MKVFRKIFSQIVPFCAQVNVFVNEAQSERGFLYFNIFTPETWSTYECRRDAFPHW